MNLILLPLVRPGTWQATTMLPVEMDPLFETALKALPSRFLPEEAALEVYQPVPEAPIPFKPLRANGLGEPLQLTTVGDLLDLKEHPVVMGPARNRATWAYLQQMSTHLLVALYWC